MPRITDLLGAITDTDLARRVGFEALNRGRVYANAGRVGRVETSDDLVVAEVHGTGAHPYTVVLSTVPGPAGPGMPSQVAMRCSCPVGGDCKHCVAVVLDLRHQRARHAGGTPEPEVAPWRTALDAFVSPPDAERLPLALQFELDGPRVLLQLRSPGRSRAWVRSDIDWQRLRYPTREFDARQRQALLALADTAIGRAHPGGPGSWGGRGSWEHATSLVLDRLGIGCWHWLREAVDAGVQLLAPRGLSHVRLGPPGRLVVDAVTQPDGSVLLDTAVEVSTGLGATEVQPALGRSPDAGVPQPASRPEPQPGSERGSESVERVVPTADDLLGQPPIGLARVVGSGLVLTPFEAVPDADLVALAVQHPRIEVPAGEVPDFLAEHLPRLRRRLPLRTERLDLPRAESVQLVVGIAVEQFAGTLSWGFRYVIGGRGVEVPVTGPDPSFRDPDAERALVSLLGDGPWTAPNGPVDTHLEGRAWMRFVEQVLPRWQEQPGIVVRLASQPEPFREAVEAPSVRLGVQPPDAAHWFGLDVEVTIDGEQVPFADLFTALALGHDELVLDSGLWFDLRRPELQALRELIAEASQLTGTPPEGLRLRPEHAAIWAELVELGVVERQAEAWQHQVDALLHVEHLPEVDPGAGVHATLRPYQLMGFRWLVFLWQCGLGGILADEMGLGKTLQSLAFLSWLKDSAPEDSAPGDADPADAAPSPRAVPSAGPALVVAPTSVLATWQREAATFTPGLRVVVRTQTTRKGGVPVAEQAAEADVVVTSHTLLRLDQDEFAAQSWSVVLVDEAQFVKNRQSQAYKAVRRLPARMKVALTGTPLENNLMDLWSLLSIVAPGLFLDPHAFTQLYRRPIEAGDADALARLQRRIRPLVLRRTKESVATELPPKQEAVLEVELDPAHRRAYDRQLQRERKVVLKLVDDLDHHRVSVLRSLTLLRRLALSPHLVDADAPATSAKIDLLVDRVRELADEGHRALVFSQFTGHLDMAEQRLRDEGIGVSRLDGSTRHRDAVVESFRGGDDPVFLISLKAGGFGLTLVEADYVFLLDPWWNPAAENQAIDRTHRIGQTRHVMVYRLVSARTIEQKVLDLQRAKRDLFDTVMDGRATGDAGVDLAAPLDADDIRALLSD